MAYLEGFQNDIFITYSHIDNQPIGEKKKCWVSDFHRDLRNLIRQKLGGRVVVWWDDRLSGADLFPIEIASQVKSTGVLVALISPSYLESEWCRKELISF